MKIIKPLFFIVLVLILPLVILNWPDKIVIVTLINRSGLEIKEGALLACNAKIEFNHLAKNKAKMIPFNNCGGDEGYIVEVKFDNGMTLSEGMGYLGDSSGHVKAYLVEIYQDKYSTTGTFIHYNREKIKNSVKPT